MFYCHFTTPSLSVTFKIVIANCSLLMYHTSKIMKDHKKVKRKNERQKYRQHDDAH